MKYPIVKFEDIRQGDTLRWYRDGISSQAVADQKISHNTWDTASGALIAEKGSVKVLYLIDRVPVPDTPEPKNIGAVVEDADGETGVRVPPSYVGDLEVWCLPDSGHLRWSDLTQPIEVKHPGWEQ